MFNMQVYTPEQVATLLQINKNTVYQLIDRGELAAKKIGKLYRIPSSALSFFLSGLDEDLYRADLEDRKQLPVVEKELRSVRAKR